MISLKSQITRKLLGYFFINPEENLYANELSRKLSLDKRNLLKKMKELESEGVLLHKKIGNIKLYSINKGYPLYNEYRKIIAKTTGFEANLEEILTQIKGVKQAYIYGSYAKNTMDVHSDVDVLVVGGHSIVALQKQVSKLQKDIGREINVVNIAEQEFVKKAKDKNSFIYSILRRSHIKVI